MMLRLLRSRWGSEISGRFRGALELPGHLVHAVDHMAEQVGQALALVGGKREACAALELVQGIFQFRLQIGEAGALVDQLDLEIAKLLTEAVDCRADLRRVFASESEQLSPWAYTNWLGGNRRRPPNRYSGALHFKRILI